MSKLGRPKNRGHQTGLEVVKVLLKGLRLDTLKTTSFQQLYTVYTDGLYCTKCPYVEVSQQRMVNVYRLSLQTDYYDPGLY